LLGLAGVGFGTRLLGRSLVVRDVALRVGLLLLRAPLFLELVVVDDCAGYLFGLALRALDNAVHRRLRATVLLAHRTLLSLGIGRVRSELPKRGRGGAPLGWRPTGSQRGAGWGTAAERHPRINLERRCAYPLLAGPKRAFPGVLIGVATAREYTVEFIAGR